MSIKTITEKNCYKVNEKSNIPFSIWITTHSFEVISSMKWEKAQKLSILINGKIIDKNVKNCCIFSHMDGNVKEEYVQMTWEELMEKCKPIEVILYD